MILYVESTEKVIHDHLTEAQAVPGEEESSRQQKLQLSIAPAQAALTAGIQEEAWVTGAQALAPLHLLPGS